SLNRMEGRSMVPPPVYSPVIVAKSICHAAEHPTRDMMVGGSGRAMTLLSNFAPNLADRLFAATFFKTALDRDKPKREMDGGFHEGGGSGEVYGDQRDWMRRHSLYSAARRHPLAASVLGVLAAGAGALILRGRPVLR